MRKKYVIKQLHVNQLDEKYHHINDTVKDALPFPHAVSGIVSEYVMPIWDSYIYYVANV